MNRYLSLLLMITIPIITVAAFPETSLDEKITINEDGRTPISLHFLGRLLATVFSSVGVAFVISFIIIPPIVYCLLCTCGFGLSGVRAHSYGAVRQSEIGYVESGSAFSSMQSMGACGSMCKFIWIGLLFGIPSGIAFGYFFAWPYFA